MLPRNEPQQKRLKYCELLLEQARDNLRAGSADFNQSLLANLANMEDETPEPEPEPGGEAEPGEGQEPEPTPEPDETTPEEPPSEGEDAPPEPASQYSPEQIAALSQLADIISRADPLTRQHIADVLERGWTPEQVAAAVEPERPAPPPAELDLDDPAIAWLAQRVEAQQAQLESYREALGRHDQIISQRELQESQSLYTRAYRDFQKEHALTDEEMNRVDRTAASLNVLPHLVQGRSRLEALEEAFKLGMRADDDLYQRALTRQAEQDRTVRAKKAKAASIASTSGVTPREASPPRDRQAAMIEAVRDAMFPPA